MASPPPTVAIYGSCVSRDTFEHCASPTTTLHRYIARHIPFGTDEHFELWSAQLRVFVQSLKQHNFLEKPGSLLSPGLNATNTATLHLNPLRSQLKKPIEPTSVTTGKQPSLCPRAGSTNAPSPALMPPTNGDLRPSTTTPAPTKTSPPRWA